MVNLILIILTIALIFALYLPQSKWLLIVELLEFKLRKLVKTLRGESGSELVQSLSFVSMQSGKLQSQLPRYKFFHELIEEAFGLRQKFGADIEEVIKALKSGIVKDWLNQKKINKEKLGSYAQFAIVSAFTWLFISVTCANLEFSLYRPVLYFFVFMHVIGLVIFKLLTVYFENKTFKNFYTFLHRVLKLNILLNCPLPTQRKIELSGIQDALDIPPKGLGEMVQFIEGMLKKWHQSGQSINEPLAYVIDELWFLHDQNLENLCKRVTYLRFLILCLCYLSTYLLFMLYLLSNLF